MKKCKLCEIFKADYAIKKANYSINYVNYAIFFRGTFSLFFKVSGDKNPFCAFLKKN